MQKESRSSVKGASCCTLIFRSVGRSAGRSFGQSHDWRRPRPILFFEKKKKGKREKEKKKGKRVTVRQIEKGWSFPFDVYFGSPVPLHFFLLLVLCVDFNMFFLPFQRKAQLNSVQL